METQTIESKPLTQKAQKAQERIEAIANLKNDYLRAGDTVYVILRHVGKIGMTRYIDLYVMRENRLLRITWTVGTALDIRYNRNHEALCIHGCGFDVGHDTVYNLAWAVFGDSAALNHQWL